MLKFNKNIIITFNIINRKILKEKDGVDKLEMKDTSDGNNDVRIISW